VFGPAHCLINGSLNP